MGDASFDACYFAHCCGVPYRRETTGCASSAHAIPEHVVRGIQPRRILDAGRALGLLVEALRARGVDAEGIDVNVQQPEHWAELFARQGFCRDVDFDASFITPWAVRLRRSAEPLPRIVRNYERRYWALNLERNETRSFSADTQRRLAETLQRLSSAEGEMARVEREWAQARDTIEHMKRSLFWKLRRVWVFINRLVGR